MAQKPGCVDDLVMHRIITFIATWLRHRRTTVIRIMQHIKIIIQCFFVSVLVLHRYYTVNVPAIPADHLPVPVERTGKTDVY